MKKLTVLFLICLSLPNASVAQIGDVPIDPPVIDECSTGFCEPSQDGNGCASCLVDWNCIFAGQAPSCQEVAVEIDGQTISRCQCECKDIPVIRGPRPAIINFEQLDATHR